VIIGATSTSNSAIARSDSANSSEVQASLKQFGSPGL
jgi:hypothetical protein